MATTMELIASNVLGSDTSSVTFSSIPGTYTDLLLVYSTRQSRSEIQSNIFIGFNGSTSSFSARYLEGSGASAGSGTFARFAGVSPSGNATASTFGNTEVYIPNYAGSTNKSYSCTSVSENNSTTAYIECIAGLWSNTAAIASIEIASGSSDDFKTGSSFFLFGIAKA